MITWDPKRVFNSHMWNTLPLILLSVNNNSRLLVHSSILKFSPSLCALIFISRAHEAIRYTEIDPKISFRLIYLREKRKNTKKYVFHTHEHQNHQIFFSTDAKREWKSWDDLKAQTKSWIINRAYKTSTHTHTTIFNLKWNESQNLDVEKSVTKYLLSHIWRGERIQRYWPYRIECIVARDLLLLLLYCWIYIQK